VRARDGTESHSCAWLLLLGECDFLRYVREIASFPASARNMWNALMSEHCGVDGRSDADVAHIKKLFGAFEVCRKLRDVYASALDVEHAELYFTKASMLPFMYVVLNAYLDRSVSLRGARAFVLLLMVRVAFVKRDFSPERAVELQLLCIQVAVGSKLAQAKDVERMAVTSVYYINTATSVYAKDLNETISKLYYFANKEIAPQRVVGAKDYTLIDEGLLFLVSKDDPDAFTKQVIDWYGAFRQQLKADFGDGDTDTNAASAFVKCALLACQILAALKTTFKMPINNFGLFTSLVLNLIYGLPPAVLESVHCNAPLRYANFVDDLPWLKVQYALETGKNATVLCWRVAAAMVVPPEPVLDAIEYLAQNFAQLYAEWTVLNWSPLARWALLVLKWCKHAALSCGIDYEQQLEPAWEQFDNDSVLTYMQHTLLSFVDNARQKIAASKTVALRLATQDALPTGIAERIGAAAAGLGLQYTQREQNLLEAAARLSLAPSK
jgi:hypothetical protein